MPNPILSNSDARTIRQARAAISLVISGATSALKSNFGPKDNPDRSIAIDALLLNCREEVADFPTFAETGLKWSDVSTGETNQPAD